ncbi:MAG: formylglycine-generating enzyme family protein [Polyangia bacterium]
MTAARPRLALLLAWPLAALPAGCGSEPPARSAPAEPEKTREKEARAAEAGSEAVSEPDAGEKRDADAESDAGDVEDDPIPEGMLPVPGGGFTMGLDDRGIPDERPAHRVEVGPFLLDATEVTNAEYDRCVDAGVCRPPEKPDTERWSFAPLERFRTPRRPVSCISRADAETYCRWAGKRLPREAEWERAARGDDGRLYPWGDEPPTPELAVYRSDVTQPVGSRPDGAGPYGHLDMAGNVWEWLADRYDPHAYRRAGADRGIPAGCPTILKSQDALRRKGKQGFTGTNPIPTTCEHVLRGGAFNYFPWGLRSSNRVHHPGHWRMIMAGTRCAADDPRVKDAGAGRTEQEP